MVDRQLTKCELEVMDVVWRLGRVTVSDVCNRLERSLAYTTVMTTFKILEEKGTLVRTTKQGRAFVYEPRVTREEVCQSTGRELRRHLFKGNLGSLLLSFADSEPLSSSEIEQLKRAVETLAAENGSE